MILYECEPVREELSQVLSKCILTVFCKLCLVAFCMVHVHHTPLAGLFQLVLSLAEMVFNWYIVTIHLLGIVSILVSNLLSCACVCAVCVATV